MVNSNFWINFLEFSTLEIRLSFFSIFDQFFLENQT